MAPPLTQSDLIFPSQNLSISQTLSSLKRSALSITNRLTSISADSDFVVSVSKAYNLPLVANERCGSWYIPPSKKIKSVYFKSTDGHTGEWAFSLRRLNLQVLDLVSGYGGCVIVDSTRRGKSMPDALSKTIPIWCCVLNRALLSHLGLHELYTSPQSVSESERVQIERRIDGFVRQFMDICRPDIEKLRSRIESPLRPIWVTQASSFSSLPDSPPVAPSFHPIVLCTASRRVHGAEASEGGYIQGAADDHEAWSHGLTPEIFWNNKNILLQTNEEELPNFITQLVKEHKGPDAAPMLVQPTSNLFISTTQNLDISPFDVIISCTPEPLTTKDPEHLKSKHYLHLRCQTGKLGSRDLRAQLIHLPAFLSSLPSQPGKFLVCCPSGKDLSVGCALAVLCRWADDDGVISVRKEEQKIDKTTIKRRLTWLTTTSPTLNAPRGTLLAVNAFLMPSPSVRQTKTIIQPTSKLVLVHENIKEEQKSVGIASDDSEEKDFEPTLSEPRSIPSEIFDSLSNSSGLWTFTRTLRSKLPTHPSGTVTGTATFTPFLSSSSPPGTLLLYAEEGEFLTLTGLRFTARRKYIYQFHPASGPDEQPYISVRFVEEAKSKESIGGLFVEMGELKPVGDGVWEAKNREQHLCAEDLYTASWKFGGMAVKEDGGNWWEVRYDVKGPRKDYVSETRYTRAK